MNFKQYKQNLFENKKDDPMNPYVTKKMDLGLGDDIKLSGKTSEDGLHVNHSHRYKVDEFGNGETQETDGHKHIITGFRVEPESGHIHFLQNK